MPRWKELKRFCERDGWELYKDTDHYYYRKKLDDGIVLYRDIKKVDISVKTGQVMSQIKGDDIKLTNPEKIVYAKTHTTKKEIIDYAKKTRLSNKKFVLLEDLSKTLGSKI